MCQRRFVESDLRATWWIGFWKVPAPGIDINWLIGLSKAYINFQRFITNFTEEVPFHHKNFEIFFYVLFRFHF